MRAEAKNVLSETTETKPIPAEVQPVPAAQEQNKVEAPKVAQKPLP